MIVTVTANPAVDRVYRIDNFSTGQVYRLDSATVSAGGKGINVARVAKTLDAKVLALGFVGGYTGNFIEKSVRDFGIQCDFTKVNGTTRTNVNITEKSGMSGEILEKGPEISSSERQSFLDTFSKAIENDCIVVISGSLPSGLDSSFYCDMVQLCHKSGRKVIVDTSGSVLIDVMKQKPFLVKPNTDELISIFGVDTKSENDIKQCLLNMKNFGVQVPFVSLGKDGAMALIDDKFVKYNIPEVEVKNTVGSGDSTIGGIAAGIEQGLDIHNAIKLGMACGVANTQFEQTGFVTKELVKKYFFLKKANIICNSRKKLKQLHFNTNKKILTQVFCVKI